jgi:AbrB family looped-hinge helix DNA binding protein
MAPKLNEWVTVNRKGQVTIPKPIRDQVGITDGGKVRFRLRYDGIVVMETNKNHNDLLGKLKDYADSENPVDAYSVR